MGKISYDNKTLNYHKIFEQIFEAPTMSIYDISLKAEMSRNTVSKYLKEMYLKDVLIGPQIRMKPAPNYKEYIYLMNFRDPFQVFEGLNKFPHVLYHAMTFGEWNVMVVTNRPLDFSRLVGFEAMVKQGVRGRSYTPKVECVTWEESFKRSYDRMTTFTPLKTEYKDRLLAPPLDWGEDEWILYRAFKYNLRKKVTPTLRRIRVRYDTYSKWIEDLEDHCSIHVGFYPGGYRNFMTYCFLFSSDHEDSLKSMLSLFPTTPFVLEMGNQLMAFINMISSEITRNLFCTIYDLKRKEMIKGFKEAVAVFHCQH